jgi:hypothetical protein
MAGEVSRLELEVQALGKTVAGAAKHPFLPAPARDAIVQAGFVVATMATEILELRKQLADVRQAVYGGAGQAGHLGVDL